MGQKDGGGENGRTGEWENGRMGERENGIDRLKKNKAKGDGR